jgi:prepilin-type N-terminal cleavage/methylation domain-containing protein
MTTNLETPGRRETPVPFASRVFGTVRTKTRAADGFTLIEMIGVLAVIAILAVALIPILIRQMDQMAADKETAQLKIFAEGLRLGISKTKSIPDEAGMPLVIASNVGVGTNQVLLNDRRVARRFKIDPAFQIGPAASPPPYDQNSNAAGSTIQPVNPRVMILSSLSPSLPALSAMNAANFDSVWNTPEGQTNAYLWSLGYTGGADLKIQRIHLADLFVKLSLINDASSVPYTQGAFKIDGSAIVVCPSSGGINSYYIDSTRLELYGVTNGLQYAEILHRAESFIFSYGTWQSGLTNTFVQAVHRPTPLDLQLAADAFTNASLNPWRDNGITPTIVYNDMISYMSNYIRWVTNSPGNSGDAPLNSAQTTLANDTTDLKDPN